jgi:alpha-N-arabinofuranosidase
VQIVNLESKTVNVDIFIDGLESSVVLSKLTKTVLTSSNVMDENSFSQPNKVSNKQFFFICFSNLLPLFAKY